ncbi:hypothetical protein ACKVMT_07230 [Halobacteriales archaeon Cl-PHB]
MSDAEGSPDTSAAAVDGEQLADRVESQVADADESVTLGDLAADVDEAGGDRNGAGGDVHEALYTRILPALDDDGTVEFDADTGIVRPVHDQPDGTRLQRGASRLQGQSALAVPVLFGLATALVTGNPLPTLGACASGLGALYLVGLLAS